VLITNQSINQSIYSSKNNLLPGSRHVIQWHKKLLLTLVDLLIKWVPLYNLSAYR
jgi:hypothetical protein